MWIELLLHTTTETLWCRGRMCKRTEQRASGVWMNSMWVGFVIETKEKRLSAGRETLEPVLRSFLSEFLSHFVSQSLSELALVHTVRWGSFSEFRARWPTFHSHSPLSRSLGSTNRLMDKAEKNFCAIIQFQCTPTDIDRNNHKQSLSNDFYAITQGKAEF